MIHSKYTYGALVYYDENENRWVDAIGNSVVKYLSRSSIPMDDSTGDPTEVTMTVVEVGAGTSIVVNSVTAGEWLTLTSAGNEYDGHNLQWKGEPFKLATNKPLYVGAQITIDEATQVDFLFGICETLTALLKPDTAHGIAAANVEGLFFFKADGGTVIAATTYKDGSSTASANSATAMDTSAHIYEIYWDGATAYFFVDGVQVTSVTADLPDGDLTLSLNMKNGSAAVRVMTVDWMRAIQLR